MKILKVNNLQERIKAMTGQCIYKLRTTAFYHLLRDENRRIIIFSFDYQKNFPLLKWFKWIDSEVHQVRLVADDCKEQKRLPQ